MHLLMVEDDLDLGRALLQVLKSEGFTVQWVRRAVDTPLSLASVPVDCVVLDLGLPDGTGFDLLRRWRQRTESAPIIIMTARSALDDRLAGLDGGADDFLVKPFAPAELVSRIRAVLRRSAQQASEVWSFGTLQIEPRHFVARLDGEPLDLSPREFRLLVELARDPDVVVPKDLLAHRLEPLGEPLGFAVIEVHLSNLRRKIGAGRIRTVRGVGYAFVP